MSHAKPRSLICSLWTVAYFVQLCCQRRANLALLFGENFLAQNGGFAKDLKRCLSLLMSKRAICTLLGLRLGSMRHSGTLLPPI
jgi:hypothetical protein